MALDFEFRKSDNLKVRVHKISAAQAARSFSEILNRIKYRGESFVVERNREPVCRIEPVRRQKPVTTENFGDFWRGLPRPDRRFADDLEKIHNVFRDMPRGAWER